ncbi:MAG: ATP-binding cassette domain-containing protein [Fidelibacterota bacterium]
MTELVFSIHFPHFSEYSQIIHLTPGLHVIYGDSGVGKSSLCRQLVQLDDQVTRTNFEIQILNTPVTKGLVLQDPDDQIVAPTLFRELAFNFENMGMESGEISLAISRAVERSHLKIDLHRHPATLSGGEKELVNLVTTMSTDPQLLVIDDGLAFLSQSLKSEMIQLVKSYALENEAVVIWTTTTHEDLFSGLTAWELKLNCFGKSSLQMEEIPLPEIGKGKMNIRCKELTFGYSIGKPVFSNLNENFGPYRSLALLGENGSGKTTFCKLLSKVIKPLSGSVTLFLGDRDNVRIGYLPQFPERMFGGFRLSELLSRMRTNKLLSESTEELIEHYLEQFNIAWDIIKNIPINGLQISVTRISLILIMFLTRYEILILDEPMFSLGYSQRSKLMNQLIDNMNQKHFIIISHSDRIISRICDASLTIRNGKLIPKHQKEIHV